MLRPRVIPCLLIRDAGLVKTRKFADDKYVGDPLNAVRIFNEKEVDELTVLDIDASRLGSQPDYAMIENLAKECRMPLCYGGGVTNAEQAKRIMGLGVEKVSLGNAAVQRPECIAEIASQVGSQSVVVIIDTKKSMLSGYKSLTLNGTRDAKTDPLTHAMRSERYGAGEIILNSIDRDGTGSGYDLELASRVRANINVPLTLLGGAKDFNDMKQAVEKLGVIGLAAGSMFVFKGQYRAVLISYLNINERMELSKIVG